MPPSPHPMIEFNGVAKTYGKRRVLNHLNLSIEPGECFALVGMNGVGKSTLIKSLLDFIELDEGTIHIGGHAHTSIASRRPLAFLPERFVPPYYLTGEDFLRYALALQSASYEPAEVKAVLQSLDLDQEALIKPVRSLSKGMTQKLGLASCFLARKPLLVLDEPMSGLDPKARALLKAKLKQMHESGTTIFFTTHALADVDEVCNRMAILNDGEIRFVGTPQECREVFRAATLEQAFMRCIGAEPATPDVAELAA